MKVKSKKLSDSRIELTVTLEAEDLKKAKDKALEKLAKEVKVEGFRKGSQLCAVRACLHTTGFLGRIYPHIDPSGGPARLRLHCGLGNGDLTLEFLVHLLSIRIGNGFGFGLGRGLGARNIPLEETALHPGVAAQVGDFGPAAFKSRHIDFCTVFQMADDIVTGFGRAADVQGLSVFGIHIHGSETGEFFFRSRKGDRHGQQQHNCCQD